LAEEASFGRIARSRGDEERVGKAKAINELERFTLMEEVSWMQKSRALWLREGDKYTVFPPHDQL